MVKVHFENNDDKVDKPNYQDKDIISTLQGNNNSMKIMGKKWVKNQHIHAFLLVIV